MKAQQHLWLRDGTWYYRRAVPKHLIATFGKKLIVYSFGVKDLAKAKKLRELADVEWSARFAAAEPGAQIGKASEPAGGAGPVKAVPSADEWMDLVRGYVQAAERRFQEDATRNAGTTAERADAVADIRFAISLLRDPDDPRSDEIVSDAAQNLLRQVGIDLTAVPAADYPGLAEIVRRGVLELNRRKLARYYDDYANSFFDTLFDPSRPAPVTFKALAEQYLAEKTEEAELNGMSAKWVDKVKARVALVRELIGDDKPVSAIDYDWCLRARSLLARTPSNRIKLYPGLSLEKAIDEAAAASKPVLAPVTQATYLDTLRDILQLAVLKGLLANNPAQTLRPLKRDDVAAKDKRLPFTLDQIKTFFASDFYHSCAPNAAKPYLKKDREWRFWLPLLCLFMGMRPNEICQMLPGDVRCSAAGTWYVDIVATSDEDETSQATDTAKTIKTATSRRKIPVHPELIALGFLDFVKGQQGAQAARLFAGLNPDKYGNLATYPLKRFRDTYLPQAINLQPRQTFYSFRHSFRDALWRSEAGPDVLKALGGWSQGNLTSDAYGDKSDPDLYVGAMAEVNFPGLDLSFLHVNGT